MLEGASNNRQFSHKFRHLCQKQKMVTRDLNEMPLEESRLPLQQWREGIYHGVAVVDKCMCGRVMFLTFVRREQ